MSVTARKLQGLRLGLAGRSIFPMPRRLGVSLSLVVLTITLCGAVLAPVIAPHDPTAQQILYRLKPPVFLAGASPSHLLGTDSLGRDMLSRLIYGARLSLLVSVTASLGACLFGTAVGLLSGRFGGWLERLLMALVDMQLSIPFILLAVTLIAVVEPGLTSIILVLIATGWPSYARVVRAETAKLNSSGFVEAAQALGQREGQILLRHILPNLLPQVIVLISMELAKFIVLESSLSFLGLGVEPSVPTWGSMAAEGREYAATHWWITTLPGIAVFAVCLSLNTLGDWLQERLDPQSA